MTNPIESRVLTKADTCAALGGISLNTLNRRIDEGTIRALKLGRRVFVPKAEIDRLLSGAA
jgi:excisionase family DNA binding protein